MPIKPVDPAKSVAPKKPRKTAPHPTDQNRTTSGTFKKGNNANPDGRPKQIFHTTKPFKQALMRALQDRTDKGNADELQKVADRLVETALTSLFPLGAISEIANRLDGSPEKEQAPPQINTLQLVMNSIRVLNLTPEQREIFAKQLTTINPASDSDGGG